jgi:hypothetical protein
MQKIKWSDIKDKMYSLAELSGINHENNVIYGLSIVDGFLVVWYYDDKNIPRHISVPIDMEKN